MRHREKRSAALPAANGAAATRAPHAAAKDAAIAASVVALDGVCASGSGPRPGAIPSNIAGRAAMVPPVQASSSPPNVPRPRPSSSESE